jgi:hypothetical protein
LKRWRLAPVTQTRGPDNSSACLRQAHTVRSVPCAQRQHRNAHGDQDVRQLLPPVNTDSNLQPLDADRIKPNGTHPANAACQLTQDQQADKREQHCGNQAEYPMTAAKYETTSETCDHAQCGVREGIEQEERSIGVAAEENRQSQGGGEDQEGQEQQLARPMKPPRGRPRIRSIHGRRSRSHHWISVSHATSRGAVRRFRFLDRRRLYPSA